MIGVRVSATNAFTSARNADPITTAIARSTTLPRMMNSLKPFNIVRTPSQRPFGRRERAPMAFATRRKYRGAGRGTSPPRVFGGMLGAPGAVERVELCHIRGRDRKVENLGVLRDAFSA